MLSKLIPFEPFHELDRFRSEINRLFSESVGRLPSLEAGNSTGLMPPVDIYSNGNELTVLTNLPGCSADDVEVSATKDTLTINGLIKAYEIPDGTTALRVERGSGKFRRVFSLPIPVEPEKVTASFNDGVLTIKLPIAEEIKSCPVKIQVT